MVVPYRVGWQLLPWADFVGCIERWMLELVGAMMLDGWIASPWCFDTSPLCQRNEKWGTPSGSNIFRGSCRRARSSSHCCWWEVLMAFVIPFAYGRCLWAERGWEGEATEMVLDISCMYICMQITYKGLEMHTRICILYMLIYGYALERQLLEWMKNHVYSSSQNITMYDV